MYCLVVIVPAACPAPPPPVWLRDLGAWQIERHHKSGEKEIDFPDGTKKIILPTGREISEFPDGVTVVEYPEVRRR